MTSELPEYFTAELVREIEKRASDPIPEEKFKELINHIDSLDEYLKNFVRHIANQEYKKDIFIVYLVYKSSSLDAFCYTTNKLDSKEKFDFIGISAGKISRLFDIFSSILSSKFSFVGYGKFDGKAEEPPPILLFPSEKNTFEYNTPTCEIRLEYSKLLTVFALQYVLFHEVTHLMNGHLEWIRENRSRKTLADGLNNQETVDNAVEMQTLEIDADQGAIGRSLELAFSIMEGLNEIKGNLSETAYTAHELAFGSEFRALRTTLYVGYILFRSEDMSKWDERELLEKSHPRPLVRARYMAIRAIEFLSESKYKPQNLDALINTAYLIIFEAEQDICRAVGRDSDKESFVNALLSESAISHLATINQCHLQMTPVLRANSREVADDA